MADRKVVFLIVVSLMPAFCSAQNHSGANIFKSHCILCHGPDATGNTPLGKQLKARNLHGVVVQKKSGAQLKQTVTNGRGSMPAFSAQLTEPQIDEVVAYIRQLGKSKK